MFAYRRSLSISLRGAVGGPGEPHAAATSICHITSRGRTDPSTKQCNQQLASGAAGRPLGAFQVTRRRYRYHYTTGRRAGSGRIWRGSWKPEGELSRVDPSSCAIIGRTVPGPPPSSPSCPPAFPRQTSPSAATPLGSLLISVR